MSRKVKFYEEISDFRKDLYIFGFPEEEVLDIIKHESAHLNKARELGYRADYCIVFSNPAKCIFRPSIHVYKGQNLSDSDLQKIISAVEDPSHRDTEKLSSLWVLVWK